MESSVLSPVLGVLFLICAIAIAAVFALFLYRLRAENQPAVEGTSQESDGVVPKGKGLRRAWPMVLGVIAVALVVGGVLAVVDQLTPPGPPVIVKVTAHQFGWRFDYYEAVDPANPGFETVSDPRKGVVKTLKIRSLGVSSEDRLTLPKDADVLFLVTSVDVIHRFWVPEFGIRHDVLPHAVAEVWVHPKRAGQFIVRSDYVCGADDRLMVAALDIVDGDGFHAWLTQNESLQDRAAAND